MKLISLDKKIADLNNLSLREVFEGGNEVVNFTWVFNDTVYENNQFIITTNDGLGFFINDDDEIGNNINDLFYLSYNVISVTATSLTTGQISSDDLFPSTTITKNIGFNSHLDNAEVANGRLSFRINNNSITISDDINLINLTALGIDLTKEQMDDYFALYQSGVEASGFVQKTSKNLLNIDKVGLTYIQVDGLIPNTNYTLSTNAPYEIPANLYFGNTSNFILTTSTNGMTNTAIRQRTIASDSLGRLWLYINTNTVHGNSIVNGTYYLQLELGTVATTYQPYRPFALAKGIDEVAYGGLTYREIFEGGNLINGITPQYSRVTNNSYNDGVLTFETNTDNGEHYTDFNLLLKGVQANNFIYVTTYTDEILVGRHFITSFYFNGSGFNQVGLLSGTTQEGLRSALVQAHPNYVSGTSLLFRQQLLSSTGAFIYSGGNGEKLTASQLGFFNLTQLFGAGNEPDKATMDKLFQQYQEGGTVQAQAFIQTAGKDTRVIDAKLPYLNMMSIREVFESNLLVNGDFSDGTSGWNLRPSTNQSVVNGINTITANATYSFVGISQSIPTFTNQSLYLLVNFNSQSSNFLSLNNGTSMGSSQNVFSNKSVITTLSSDGTFRVMQSLTSGQSYQVDYIYFINLTALNLTHLTQAELDAMFALYQDASKNLFDKSTIVAGSYYSITGPLAVDTTSEYSTQYIEVLPNTAYIGVLTGQLFIIEYDANKNFIKRTIPAIASTFTTTTSTHFIRISQYQQGIGKLETLQLELGTTATTYTRYNGWRLSDVFETGNLVVGSDLTNTINGVTYTRTNNNVFIVNGINTASYSNTWIPSATYNGNIYLRYEYISGNITLEGSNRYSLQLDAAKPVTFDLVSRIDNYTNYTNSLRSFSPINTIYEDYKTNFYAINLNTHNLQATTQTFMDDLFKAYQRYSSALFIDKQGVAYAPVFLTHAGIDTVYADLGNRSLREVFEGGNLVTNYDFSDGINGWTKSSAATYSVTNGIMTFLASSQFNSFNQQVYNSTTVIPFRTHTFYHVINYKTSVTTNSQVNFTLNDGITENNNFALTTENDIFTTKSILRTISASATQLRLLHYDNRTSGFTNINVDYNYLINLTTLGLTSLTKAQLDHYFKLYQRYRGN